MQIDFLLYKLAASETCCIEMIKTTQSCSVFVSGFFTIASFVQQYS